MFHYYQFLDTKKSQQAEFGDVSFSKVKKYIDGCSAIEPELSSEHIAFTESQMQTKQLNIPVMQLIRQLEANIDSHKKDRGSLQLELQDALSYDTLKNLINDGEGADVAVAADELVAQLTRECLQLEEELNRCVYS